MSSFKTLLFATDFSEGSIKAARVARELAELGQAKLYVVNVVALLRDSYSWNSVLLAASVSTEELDNDIIKVTRESLEEFTEQHLKPGADAHYSIETRVLTGASVHDELINLAQEVGVGTIILGTHGRSGLNRALVGSVAEQMVRSSPIPVLTVHG